MYKFDFSLYSYSKICKYYVEITKLVVLEKEAYKITKKMLLDRIRSCKMIKTSFLDHVHIIRRVLKTPDINVPYSCDAVPTSSATFSYKHTELIILTNIFQ